MTSSQSKKHESIESYRDVIENIESNSFDNILNVFSLQSFPESKRSLLSENFLEPLLESVFVLARAAKVIGLNKKIAYASSKFPEKEIPEVEERLETIKERNKLTFTYNIRKRIIELSP
jgi:hypothetical protein